MEQNLDFAQYIAKSGKTLLLGGLAWTLIVAANAVYFTLYITTIVPLQLLAYAVYGVFFAVGLSLLWSGLRRSLSPLRSDIAKGLLGCREEGDDRPAEEILAGVQADLAHNLYLGEYCLLGPTYIVEPPQAMRLESVARVEVGATRRGHTAIRLLPETGKPKTFEIFPPLLPLLMVYIEARAGQLPVEGLPKARMLPAKRPGGLNLNRYLLRRRKQATRAGLARLGLAAALAGVWLLLPPDLEPFWLPYISLSLAGLLLLLGAGVLWQAARLAFSPYKSGPCRLIGAEMRKVEGPQSPQTNIAILQADLQAGRRAGPLAGFGARYSFVNGRLIPFQSIRQIALRFRRKGQKKGFRIQARATAKTGRLAWKIDLTAEEAGWLLLHCQDLGYAIEWDVPLMLAALLPPVPRPQE